MATKAKPKFDYVLCDGVGFEPDRERGSHYVVLMHSFHSGTEVFGPFLNEEAAYTWVREHGDDECYNHWGRARVEGVEFYVKWLDIPRRNVPA